MKVSRKKFFKLLSAIPAFGVTPSGAWLHFDAPIYKPEPVKTATQQPVNLHGANYVLIHSIAVIPGLAFQFDLPIIARSEDGAMFRREDDTFMLKHRGLVMVSLPLNGARKISCCVSAVNAKTGNTQYHIERIEL
jgi:hypothetical protein